MELANPLRIVLNYVPPYRPNLIKGLWKFIKEELRTKYYDNFSIFQAQIDSIIESMSNENKGRLFQLIRKDTIV